MPPDCMSLDFLTMRNKLKRSRGREDAAGQSKIQTQSAKLVATVSSASSCSDGKTDSASPAAAAGISGSKYLPPQEQRKTCCAKDVKIAPIFLRTPRQSKSQGNSDAKQQKSVPPPPPPPPQVKSQSRLSPSARAHLTEEEGLVPSDRRGQLSPSSLRSCLEEIEASNPAFPVQTVFGALQKKASESPQEFGSTEPLLYPGPPLNRLKEKRRPGDECDERAPKRPRRAPGAEEGPGVERRGLSAHAGSSSSSSKLSRAHWLAVGRRASLPRPDSERTNDTGSGGQPPATHDAPHRGSSSEDLLWTDKYSPRHSSEVIGNSASVTKLHSWLKRWKLLADCEERRRRVEEQREEEDNSRDLWDAGDFQGEAGAEVAREDLPRNTLLITGPPGVGKTASVYACAQELGFKVFEVNCSSRRSGRHVLCQLKEATQSHLVETSGKDPLRPAYFNNYSTGSCSSRPEAAPGKTWPPRNVITTSKKRAGRSSGRRGRAGPATVTLANYFKTKAQAELLRSGGPSPPVEPGSEKVGDPSPGRDQTGPQSKKTTTSLILFEEVDVIFDDDVGFLAAIKAFMATAKRPVVLTTNDPLFRERFGEALEEIVFKTPSAVNVCSYLRLVCLAESVRLGLEDVRSLLGLTCGDVRRCLLQLQLWARGGGRAPQGTAHVHDSKAAEGGGNLESSLPPCDTGCVATMLGLHPLTQNHLLELLKRQRWSDADVNELPRLLAESWRGGAPLLYNNLELLLPAAAASSSSSSVRHLGKVSCCGLQSGVTPSDTEPRDASPSGTSVRNISRLSRRKYTSTTRRPQKPSQSFDGTRPRPQCPGVGPERTAAKVAAGCLDALADFFDLMSYLDSTLPAASSPPLPRPGSRRPEAFVWTGAEVRDGLLDEASEEEGGRSWGRETLPDIQAAAEGLGCHRCWWRVSEARELEGTEWERLVQVPTFPAASKTRSLRFGFQPPCAASVSRRRYELSRTVLSSESFSLLGNRRAVGVDYAPVLRSICRLRRAQRQKEEPARCPNYLSSFHLSESTIQRLAEDFP